MSKFDMGWRDHLRLQYGLRWRGSLPPASAIGDVIVFVSVVALWVIAMTRDYWSFAQ